MAGVLVLATPLPFVATLLLAGISYVLLLWLTQAITSQEVMSVFSSKDEPKEEIYKPLSA